MSRNLRFILFMTMTTALTCGFLHHLFSTALYNFERLHIFLFNLCSGGTMLLFFTENKPSLSRNGQIFYLLSLAFALCAFNNWYPPTLVIPLVLCVIVEQIRIARFGSFLPRGLASPDVNVAEKFHEAALLCLSIGLLLSSPVILNSIYGHWLTIDKLKLDTFFLGFSFPISLISMSVIFSLMKEHQHGITLFFQQLSFWTINLGVIIFFLFILAKWFVPQVMIASTLVVAVLIVLILYLRLGMQLQQKKFLTSGIMFLLVTSFSGIAYILLSFSEYYTPAVSQPLLRLHAFTALYGWNLSGLIVISRHSDFPIRLHSRGVLALHWLTVLILCPLGFFVPACAAAAICLYFWLLYILLFNDGQIDDTLDVTLFPQGPGDGLNQAP